MKLLEIKDNIDLLDLKHLVIYNFIRPESFKEKEEYLEKCAEELREFPYIVDSINKLAYKVSEEYFNDIIEILDNFYIDRKTHSREDSISMIKRCLGPFSEEDKQYILRYI